MNAEIVSLDLPFEFVKKAKIIGPGLCEGTVRVLILSGKAKGREKNIDPVCIVKKA